MPDRTLTYFVSDVHLGLNVKDPADREKRFVAFLKSIPRESTESLYMLGDNWDFWYEYRDVEPKGYVRVFAELLDLMDNGVKVYFFQGNHDIWCFSYFEELGIQILQQPYCVDIHGKTFCLGHGDGLGPGHKWYKLMRWGLRHPVYLGLASLLHPTLAFRFGEGWSRRSRVAKSEEYVFKGEEEPIYKFAVEYSKTHKVDCFIFGHFHCKVDMTLPGGERLMVLKDWMDAQSSNFILTDGISVRFGISQNMEK